jgi:hypothetical protein
VLLGLAFGQSEGEPVMVMQPPVSGCQHASLEEALIRKAVRDGLAEAREKAGTAFHVTEIVYVADDSPRYDIYQDCACLLAQRVASGAEFAESQ